MRAEYAGFLPPPQAAFDDPRMRKKERRHRRASTITEALNYQLEACCVDGSMDAMVVADRDGLALGIAGDRYACDEVAARAVLIGTKIGDWIGTLFGGSGKRWDVETVIV